MKTLFVFIIIGLSWCITNAQESIPIKTIETGIKFADGVLSISEENKRLLSDKAYREQIYPDQYTFQVLPDLLQNGNMSLTLWHLINLYQLNPVFTLRIINDISALDVRGEHLAEAFHTYAYTDPKVSKIDNGHYELMKPEALDKHIKATNALAYFLTNMQATKSD